MAFHYMDYIIFVLFLVCSLSIGLYHAFRSSTKQATTEEFLMGSRSLHTLPVAISITLSFISAILVLGQPAEVYTRGTQFSLVFLGHLIGCVFVNIYVVPIFFDLKVTSSFEYFELRFGSRLTKLVGTISMIVCSMIQLGIVLYAPAVALEAVAGVPTWASIIISSFVAIVYTTLGGMKAVIWTDVFQGGCVMIGMIAVIVKGTIEVGGPSEVWQRNTAMKRLEFFKMSLDPTVRTTFWSSVVSGIFFNLSCFGVGQTTVQRYCALPSLGKARCSLILSTCLLSIIIVMSTAVGMVIFAYYDMIGCDPVRNNAVSNPNQLLPYFVINVLNYPGFPGLFISVLYAGALSTMSSSLNSVAAVTWQDILKNMFRHLDDSKKALMTKALVVVFGTVSVAMAFLAGYLGDHVLQAANTVFGTFGGPMLGMFMLGMFFKCANAKGVVVGCLSGTIATTWLAIGSLATNHHNEILPTKTDSCYNFDSIFRRNFSSTSEYPGSIIDLHLLKSVATERNFSDIRKHGINDLYSISYLLLPIIGLLITIVIGLITSVLIDFCDTPVIGPKSLTRKLFKKDFIQPKKNIVIDSI